MCFYQSAAVKPLVSNSSHLKVAEVNHAIHHLAHTEAMTEVMERVATVILLNSKLGKYVHEHYKLYSFFPYNHLYRLNN